MANHHFETDLDTNTIYEFCMDNSALYHGKFKEIKGCWGTVEVVRVLDSPDAKYYRIGDSFEIKIAMYDIKAV
jgi:hypothetical protein